MLRPALFAFISARLEQPWTVELRHSSQCKFLRVTCEKKFGKPAMLRALNSAKSLPVRPPGPSAEDAGWMRPQPKKTTFDPKGQNLLGYTWSRRSRGQGGCSNDK